jgi:hypothetical protein
MPRAAKALGRDPTQVEGDCRQVPMAIQENRGDARMHKLQTGSECRPLPGAPRSRRERADSGHEWPKSLLSTIAFFLETRDLTDTVDRLFDSRHVNDLRLIAATAFCATCAVFIIALVGDL